MPECFGQDTPNHDACCELWGPLKENPQSEFAGHKKLVIAGAMKAGTSFVYKALQVDAKATVTSACYPSWRVVRKEAHFFS